MLQTHKTPSEGGLRTCEDRVMVAGVQDCGSNSTHVRVALQYPAIRYLGERTVKHQHLPSTPDWGIPRHWQAHGFRREGLWI